MKDNNYSTVEGILYNLPKLKVEIDNLKLDLEEAQEIVGITGASGNEKAGSATYAFSSVVENEVIERERDNERRIQGILKDIQKKEREFKRIENVLSLLSESDFLLIELRYFKGYSINRVCELLDITATTFNKRRKVIIVKKIMPLLV
nr:hypothetical protein [uncultured Cellulosilyticum sp.]